MSETHILLILSDPNTVQLLDRAILNPAGYRVTAAFDWKAIETILENDPPALVILSEKVGEKNYNEIATLLLDYVPFLPLILLPTTHSEELAVDALRLGFIDYLRPPLRSKEVQDAVSHALGWRERLNEHIQLEAKRDTKSLRKRVNGMEAIQRVGRQVTSLLNLDSVLTAVVDAAVDLTEAEEGSLLLLDESTGELYMRASRNFQDDFVSTFRLPIRDSLVGQVLKTGKPLLLDEKTPQKIKTAYLVHTIIYVPLMIQERIIGVLEVDNRKSGKSFTDYHITLVSALADYAAIAIENARLYSHSEQERSKLEGILNGVEDGVIVVDQDRRLVLINQKARQAFGVSDDNVEGRRVREVIHHSELLETLRDHGQSTPIRVELTLEDERVLNAQLTPIPEIGVAITMQDITHLKELDRIKSDFVNTVSHDLRSPLTAILGYVELIDRVGPVTNQQKEFIRRVQISVHNITTLINDLLDLGRIEAGFDARNEIVPFSAIIQYAIDGLSGRAAEKSQSLQVDIPADLPQVLGNPIRLRQMVNNLLSNAIKYTPKGGAIQIYAHSEGGQIILQISDNGPGIPPADQPYIFDKFYRASNAPVETPGSGLGLAIVKSIVDNHLGRIWVDSVVGKGTTFTIVLPIADSVL